MYVILLYNAVQQNSFSLQNVTNHFL